MVAAVLKVFSQVCLFTRRKAGYRLDSTEERFVALPIHWLNGATTSIILLPMRKAYPSSYFEILYTLLISHTVKVSTRV
jgi:hypothetical protein